MTPSAQGPAMDPMGPLDDVDDQILEQLRSVAAKVDPVPAGMTDDIKFALTARALQAEIAELELLGAGELVRSVDYTRAETLSFTSTGLTVMVTVTAVDSATVRIDGWVTGASVEVEIREVGRETRATPDEDGHFAARSVRRGMVQFVFHPTDGGRPVITPAVDL
ncbi:carboxypeptidase regulatory-like domain-containing protein [Janibacter sp. G56]|uniref:carboxypeptidase regulatory-like domain-containing protein n=1 Tax=Janibacter sp. G56 TaxID=3418717 RepID=UPI003D027DB9